MTQRYLPEGWVLPAITETNAAYFTSGVLRLQRCRDCGTLQHPPLEICNRCQSDASSFVTAIGTARVEAITIVHHPVHPDLADVVPYNVVVVALDDYPHVRIVGNVINCTESALIPGLQVEVTWAPVTNEAGVEVYLAQWQPIEGRAN